MKKKTNKKKRIDLYWILSFDWEKMYKKLSKSGC